MGEYVNGASLDDAAPKKGPKPIIEQAPAPQGATSEASGERAGAADPRAGFDAAAPSVDGAPSTLTGATAGFFRNVGRFAWSYANAHPHATLYGIIGFLLAVLILSIGLWDTLIIAVFVGVGVILGQMVDGDNALVNFIARAMRGRK